MTRSSKRMPKRDQQVGFLDGGVDPGLAVHAHHAEVERMRGGNAADAEQRHRDRDVARARRTRAPRRSRSEQDDAVAGEDQRPLGGVDQRAAPRAIASDSPARSGRACGFGAAASQSNSHDVCCASLVMSMSTGPGPAAGARCETPRARRRDVLRARHQVVVLGDRQRDAGDVGFLETRRSRSACCRPGR